MNLHFHERTPRRRRRKRVTFGPQRATFCGEDEEESDLLASDKKEENGRPAGSEI